MSPPKDSKRSGESEGTENTGERSCREAESARSGIKTVNMDPQA